MPYKNILAVTILTAIFIITFFSCQKFEKKDEILPSNQETELQYIKFSQDFNWQSSRIVNFHLSSENSQIVLITSINKEITYYKGMIKDNAANYLVKISVPLAVKELIINDQEIEVNSPSISIKL